MDFVYTQMSLAQVKNCWLRGSYETVPPIVITHIQNMFRQANFAYHFTSYFYLLFVLQFLGPWIRFLDINLQGLPNILLHNCASFCNDEYCSESPGMLPVTHDKSFHIYCCCYKTTDVPPKFRVWTWHDFSKVLLSTLPQYVKLYQHKILSKWV